MTKDHRITVIFLMMALCLAPGSGLATGPKNKGTEAQNKGTEAKPATAPRRPPTQRARARKAPTPPVYRSVVTAQRLPQDPFRADRSLSVVDSRRLVELTPRTLPEALWESNGVFVQETNFGGGSPIIRGLVGPQVLILVDGVRLNNSIYRTGPVQYLNLIDPHSIDRVEVLRGPGSVLYGSDAMGGVIQVFPTGPRDYRGTGGLGYGGRVLSRFDSASRGRTGHGRLELGTGGFSALVGMTYKGADDLSGGRGVGVQPYSGYTHWSATGQLEYRFSTGFFQGWRAKVGYLMARVLGAGRTDKLYSNNSLQMYDDTDDLVYGQLHMVFRPLQTTGRLVVSYQHFYEQKDNLTLADDLVTEEQTTRDRTRVHTAGVDLQLRTRLLGSRLQLQYGGSWYRDVAGSSSSHRLAGEAWTARDLLPYPDGSTYQNWGAFVLLGGTPLLKNGHRLHLTAGYRVHGMQGDAPAQPALPAVDFSHLGHVFMASARYLYLDRATLAFNFSQGFRAPNLFEAVMLGDSGQFFHIPNKNLGPERSDTFELLFRGRFGRLTFRYAVYATLLHSLMKRDFTTFEGETEVGGKPVTWNVNAGEGLMFGMESSLHLELGRGFSANAFITYTWGDEWRDDASNLPLRLVPPLFGGGTLRYQTRPVGKVHGFAETSLRGAGKQVRLSPEDAKDTRIPQGGTPGWVVWNIRAGLTLWQRLRLILAVDNLTNAKYKYHGSGVWAPGTNVMLTAETWL